MDTATKGNTMDTEYCEYCAAMAMGEPKRHIPACDRCGDRGTYERGAHHTRRVPVGEDWEWDVFAICDRCAAERGDAVRQQR